MNKLSIIFYLKTKSIWTLKNLIFKINFQFSFLYIQQVERFRSTVWTLKTLKMVSVTGVTKKNGVIGSLLLYINIPILYSIYLFLFFSYCYMHVSTLETYISMNSFPYFLPYSSLLPFSQFCK